MSVMAGLPAFNCGARAPPSLKSRAMFFFGRDSGISSTWVGERAAGRHTRGAGAQMAVHAPTDTAREARVLECGPSHATRALARVTACRLERLALASTRVPAQGRSAAGQAQSGRRGAERKAWNAGGGGRKRRVPTRVGPRPRRLTSRARRGGGSLRQQWPSSPPS